MHVDETPKYVCIWIAAIYILGCMMRAPIATQSNANLFNVFGAYVRNVYIYQQKTLLFYQILCEERSKGRYTERGLMSRLSADRLSYRIARIWIKMQISNCILYE